jgi:hypothetical protein
MQSTQRRASSSPSLALSDELDAPGVHEAVTMIVVAKVTRRARIGGS